MAGERLPVVAGDVGAWGTILNAYLGVEHGSDGKHGFITASRLTIPAAGTTVINHSTIVNIDGQNNRVENIFEPITTGSDQQIGVYANMVGRSSGSGTGDQSSRIGIVSRVASPGTGTGPADWLRAFNGIAILKSGDPAAAIIGMEIGVANNSGTDATIGMLNPQVGVSVNSSGSKAAEYAFNAAGTGKWLIGYHVAQGGIHVNGFAFNYDGDGGTNVFRVAKDTRVGIGTLSPDAQCHIGGVWTGVTQSEGFRIATTLTGQPNASVFGAVVRPVMTEAASGVHSQLTSLYVQPLVASGAGSTSFVYGINVDTMSLGAIAPTNGVALRLVLPTGATSNFVMELPEDNTDPTAGGGAAVGRIRVLVNGVLRHLAYY